MEQNQQQQQKFQCTGDCLNCRAINDRRLQWQYCAAQFTYNTMRMIQTMQESMDTMAGTIEELKVKVEAIQDSEAMVFEPDVVQAGEPLGAKQEMAVKSALDIAQEGDGAEE